jgi:hypothetical protein
MTPAQRCDEIIKMIDSVLEPDATTEGPTDLRCPQGPALDPRFAPTRFESRP